MVTNKNKKRDLIQLTLSILLIVLLNYVNSFIFNRFDLTTEKRYSLADATKNLLKNTKDVIYVRVYLEGEFPAGFKKLRDETKVMLDEFRNYAGDNIEYEFINPSANANQKDKDDLYRQLAKKGLEPTNLEIKDDGGTSQQIIFPGAIISYNGRETTWQLLKNQVGIPPDQILNNSVQALEYEFSLAIKKLSTPFKPKIAFIEGHNELDTLHVADIANSLKEFYEIERVEIGEQISALTNHDSIAPGKYKINNKFTAIVIAKPDSAFTDKETFVIDQFAMYGGKILWLIDPVNTNIDSLKLTGFTLGFPNELNIENMLFKYGVRANTDLILDLQASPIPVNKALAGQQPRFEMEPWLFYPLVMPNSNHPIVNNLDLIRFEFVSTLDTIASKGIKKTILLTSSKYSRKLNAPARISLGMVNIQPDERKFTKRFLPVSVLLEGKFESFFKNRIPPQLSQDPLIGFKEAGKETKMIVVSDGDIIKNEVRNSQFLPLGYDRFTNKTFGNKTFILNCINYLCDDNGLMQVRTKDLKLRLMDKKKIKEHRLKWQIINVGVPIIIVILFGFFQSANRKRKYTS